MESVTDMTVKKICHQQIEGLITKDIDLLNHIIDSDAVIIHITGERQTKDEWFKEIRSGRMRYFSNQEIGLTVEVNGAHALVHMRNIMEARIYGFRNTWSLDTDIKAWKKKDQWKIIEYNPHLV